MSTCVTSRKREAKMNLPIDAEALWSSDEDVGEMSVDGNVPACAVVLGLRGDAEVRLLLGDAARVTDKEAWSLLGDTIRFTDEVAWLLLGDTDEEAWSLLGDTIRFTDEVAWLLLGDTDEEAWLLLGDTGSKTADEATTATVPDAIEAEGKTVNAADDGISKEAGGETEL